MDYKKLSEVANITMGQSPSSESYNLIGEGVPFFQGKADFGKINPSVRMYCNAPSKMAYPNEVLMSVRAPVGDVNISNVECCIGRGLAAISARDKILDSKYLFYVLQMKKEQISALGTGSTFKAINKGILEQIEVPMVDIVIQKKIVSVLDKAQQLIDKRKEQIQACDELIKSQFIEMFGDPIKNEKGWNVCKLNDVCNGIGDGLHGTPVYEAQGKYPFVNGNNLVDGKIMITSNTLYVGEDEFKKYHIDLSENAILISINGTLGKLAFYNGEDIVLGKSACYCNLKEEVNKKFIYGLMKSESFIKYITGEATASTIKNVSLKTMRNYPLINPPLELQNEFAQFVQQVDKLKFGMEQSLKELEDNFDSLMQRAFIGELF